MTVAELEAAVRPLAPAGRVAGAAAAAATAVRGREEPPAAWRKLVVVHSLGWLVASSAAGLLMASLLLAPGLGDLLAPLTYGRWVPLHLDLALYGWLALPVVGLLLAACSPRDGGGWLPLVAIHAWSASLAAGAVDWLAGGSSGKPFLDWRGPMRWLFVGALAVLWVALARGVAGRLADDRRAGLPRRRRLARTLPRALLLAALAAVPAALALATRASTYPPVNPQTGGPTGASLLGSSLVVVAVLLAAPALLGLRAAAARRAWPAVALLAAQAVAFLLLGSGDHGHREPLQIAAVAALLPWGWLLPSHLRRFDWPEGGRRWLAACFGWGALLLASAVAGFLPGLLERQKFTHLLVAHAHLAMAGFASAFAALVLVAVGGGARGAAALARRRPFALWNGGLALHLGALAAVGGLEVADPGILFRPSSAVAALLALRWLAGAAMLAAAVAWLRGALARRTR